MQRLFQLSQSAAAVGYLIFGFRRQFAERAAAGRHIEQRVISKSARAMAFTEQLPLALAAHGQRFPIRQDARDRAHETAGAVILILHIAQQQVVARPIGPSQ